MGTFWEPNLVALGLTVSELQMLLRQKSMKTNQNIHNRVPTLRALSPNDMNPSLAMGKQEQGEPAWSERWKTEER